MPRDADGVGIQKWASSGDTATPESQGLTQAAGWTPSYSASGGDTPQREVFNWQELRATAFMRDVEEHGLLEWDTGLAYVHPALVMGSDGLVYLSVQNSTGQDPTSDTSDTYWESFGQLANDSVGGSQLADGSVGTRHLGNGAVTNAKLGADAVTTGNLADGAVDEARLANSAVTNSKLANGAVTNQKLGTGAVSTSKLANAAVTADKLSAGLANASFDLHDDVSTEMTSPSASDRLVASDESAVGDPNRWMSLTRLATYLDKITISDNAPTSSDGSNGDVWLEY